MSAEKSLDSAAFENIVIRQIAAVTRVSPKRAMRMECRPRCAAVYKISGETVYESSAGVCSFRAGTFLFLPQGASYSNTPTTVGESIMADFTVPSDFHGLPDRVCVFDLAGSAFAAQLFRELEICWTFKKTAYMNKCFSLLYEIFSEVALCRTGGGTRAIEAAVAYLEANYGDPSLNIKTLAEKAGLSVSHFRRLFAASYGMSPGRYIGRIRVSKARDLLISGGLTVGEIAELTGFSNIYYFSSAFKKETGVSPSACRP